MSQNQPQNRESLTESGCGLGRLLFVLAAALLLILGGTRTASAFAILGPQESWMDNQNGFNPLPYDGLAAFPHELGQEFRRNTPVMYWACDETFLDFFGSNGVSAIEQAFSAFNAVGSVSSYSLDLSEWPMESERHNYEAQALDLLDLKSWTMGLLMEQMGLSYPVRYMWVIHNRAAIPSSPPCPDGMDYIVVQRNYDPVPADQSSYQSSSYVNGTLYSYFIDEACTTAFPPRTDAVEFPVDAEADVYTSVADYRLGLDPGGFYLSLTHDDVGGLRYLLHTNNINTETIPPQAVEFVTNSNPQLIFGSNLTVFAAQALTNDAAGLTALYPGLVITDTTNVFGFTTNTIITATLVPGPPWAPAGTFQLTFSTNVIRTPQLQFIHTFANIASFQLVNGQWTLVPFTMLSQVTGNQIVNFQTISTVVTNPPFLPAQDFEVVTTTNNRLRIQNGPVGEFIILATNGFCDLRILDNIFTNVVAVSNLLTTGSNIVVTSTGTGGSTNVTGTNFFNGQVLSNSLTLFTYFTNHAFYVQPVTCLSSNTGSNTFTLFQGVDHLSFIRHDFDSLLGRFFQPVTNDYIMNEITNGIIVPRSIRRIVTQPDFVFGANDQIGGPSQFPVRFSADQRNLNFNPGISTNGPGTIDSPTRINFNKGAPAYENFRLDPFRFLDELTQLPILAWGSFDGTTNSPVVYPNGEALSGIQNSILLPISPDNLPVAQAGVAYSQQFSSLGGQAPLAFSLAPGSNPLPSGFSLASNGTFSGTSTAAGNFEFIVRLTDSTGRIADRLYTFVVTP